MLAVDGEKMEMILKRFSKTPALELLFCELWHAMSMVVVVVVATVRSYSSTQFCGRSVEQSDEMMNQPMIKRKAS